MHDRSNTSIHRQMGSPSSPTLGSSINGPLAFYSRWCDGRLWESRQRNPRERKFNLVSHWCPFLKLSSPVHICSSPLSHRHGNLTLMEFELMKGDQLRGCTSAKYFRSSIEQRRMVCAPRQIVIELWRCPVNV